MDVKSLAEIGVLEAAYETGATSLGTAKAALKARWSANLRDNETFIRLLFLSWYSCSEPNWLTGLEPSEENEFDNLVTEGGVLESESKFILGVLSNSFPYCCGEEGKWEQRSRVLFQEAEESAPYSLVFRNWEYLLSLSEEPKDPRIHIKPELYARFHGRGYMGTYLLHILGQRVGL
ncbi:hypothetical protein [Microbulbifer guangxiensis]|uniref:hypothetical protein n=1 Tax=Microbulbifer guangxiensis TaxID=2904249 RepID=UPI001F2E91C7|nr:hypothetical protein [Microbulbifer guangxiensis]